MAQISKTQKLGTLVAKGQVQNRSERAKIPTPKKEAPQASQTDVRLPRTSIYDLRQQATRRTRNTHVPKRN